MFSIWDIYLTVIICAQLVLALPAIPQLSITHILSAYTGRIQPLTDALTNTISAEAKATAFKDGQAAAYMATRSSSCMSGPTAMVYVSRVVTQKGTAVVTHTTTLTTTTSMLQTVTELMASSGLDTRGNNQAVAAVQQPPTEDDKAAESQLTKNVMRTPIPTSKIVKRVLNSDRADLPASASVLMPVLGMNKTRMGETYVPPQRNLHTPSLSPQNQSYLEDSQVMTIGSVSITMPASLVVQPDLIQEKFARDLSSLLHHTTSISISTIEIPTGAVLPVSKRDFAPLHVPSICYNPPLTRTSTIPITARPKKTVTVTELVTRTSIMVMMTQEDVLNIAPRLIPTSGAVV